MERYFSRIKVALFLKVSHVLNCRKCNVRDMWWIKKIFSCKELFTTGQDSMKNSFSRSPTTMCSLRCKPPPLYASVILKRGARFQGGRQ